LIADLRADIFRNITDSLLNIYPLSLSFFDENCLEKFGRVRGVPYPPSVTGAGLTRPFK
jgi:hypothetical protein